MNKIELAKLDLAVQELLLKRENLYWQTYKSANRDPVLKGQMDFFEHFKAQICRAQILYGDAFDMLEILKDDNRLIDGTLFDTNFQHRFSDILDPELCKNQTWNHLMPVLIRFKGERVGAGELFLSLIVKGWLAKRGNTGKGDGMINGGMREVKEEGASLKPLSDHTHKVIDGLVKDVFQGRRPGPLNEEDGQSFQLWRTWFDSQSNQKQILEQFFRPLYKDQPVDNMIRELLKETDGQKFYNVVGKNVLGWYQKIDNWKSIVIIDKKNLYISNIVDTNDLSQFPNIRFQWVTQRNKDVRQHADGYVNIFLTPPQKDKKEKKSKAELSPELFIIEQEQKQATINADEKFVGFLTDPKDPLTKAWRKVDPDNKVDAKDFILEMIKDGKYSNAEIATTVVKSFC